MPFRQPLAAALLAALPLTASAELSVNHGGSGDALYLPLYDVAEGRDSLLTVRNAGSRPTAARIVIAEADNGQAVLNFNVFLPAYAIWTAALVDDREGATLVSASPVCSVPAIPPAGVALRPFDYTSNFPDGGATTRARTRRGAIEVFELGTLEGSLAAATANGACASLLAAYQPGNSRSGAFATPASALAGSVQVVEVSEGVVYALPAVALRGFHSAPVDAAPGADLPRLTTPQLPAGSSHHIAAGPAGRFRFAANRGADAVSSLFMSRGISGEVLGDPALEGRTQWLLAFPTKSAYVADLPGTLASGGPAVAPFRERFGADGSCELLPSAAYGVTGGGVQFTVPVPYAACTQVALRDFDPAAGSGSNVLRFDDTAQRHLNAERVDGSPVRLRGLPVLGWRLSRFVNAAAQPGVLANYSVALPLQVEPAVVEAR